MKINKDKYMELMRNKGVGPEILPFKPHETEWILSGRPCTYWAIEQCALAVGVDPAEIAELEENMSGENVLEFPKNGETATVTLCKPRYISRIRELAEERPVQCQIVAENTDGSIVAHIPSEWIRINPDRILTDEQRERAKATALKNFHADS